MPYTYATLTADVIANLEEDSDEFVAALPLIVERAQTYLQKRLDLSQLTTLVTVSASAGSRAIALPSDLLVLKSVQASVSSGWTNLLQQTGEYLTSYWPVYTSVGEPKYYAEQGNTQIFVAPTPASDTTVVLEYVAKVPILTSTATTNWLSENADSAFFAAAMMYANMWTKNGEATQAWKATLDEELAVLNNEARRQRRSDTSDRSNGAPENTLGGNA